MKLKQIIPPNFSEFILYDMSMGKKIGYIALTHRSPSQTANKFDKFDLNLENFENLLYQI